MTMDDDNSLLTLDEVAQLLKVTRPQVLELTRKRTQERSDNPLPVIRFHSKMLRVRRKDFFQWVEKVAASQSVREVNATTTRSSATRAREVRSSTETKKRRIMQPVWEPKNRKLRHRFSAADINRSVLDRLLKRMKTGGAK